MKNLTLPIICLLAVFISCKKKDESTTRYQQIKSKNAGTVTFTLNGEHWPLTTSVVALTGFANDNKDCFNVTLEMFSSEELQMNSLFLGSVSIVPKSSACSTLHWFYITPPNNPDRFTHPVAGFTIDYEDATANTYDIWPDSSVSNVMTVDSYDAPTKRAKGRFNFTLVRSDGHAGPADRGFPDTLKITDGKFDVIVKE
jgi:hypothetical protein